MEQNVFDKDWFKKTPKWKLFFIKIFGTRNTIISTDSAFPNKICATIGYKLRGMHYISEIKFYNSLYEAINNSK